MQKKRCAVLFILMFLAAFAFAQDEAGDDELYGDELFFMEGEGLTVTGSKKSSQQTMTLERADIEKYHAADTVSLLEKAFGLTTARYGAYGSKSDINLRGPGRAAVLIDGVPANSALSGGFDLNSIAISGIEEIVVTPGAADTKFNVSGSVDGIINIITVKEQKKGFSFAADIKNTGTAPGNYVDRAGKAQSARAEDLADGQRLGLSAGYGTEKLSFGARFTANRAANHFLYKDYYDDWRRKENSEVYDSGGGLFFIGKLASDAAIIAKADAYYADKNVPVTAASSVVGKEKDLVFRESVMLDMPVIFRDDLSMEASVSHSFMNTDYDSPGENSKHNENTITLINRWGWYPLSFLTVRAGFDYRFTGLDSTDTGLRFGHDGGCYFGAEVSPAAPVQIVGTIKYIFSSYSRGSFLGLAESEAIPTVVPKLGVVWHAAECLDLRQNFYRGFKFPDFEDLYWKTGGYSGNPNLKPEDSWGGDVGAAFALKGFSFDNTLYAAWIRDSIHWTYSGAEWKPMNSGEAVYWGFDTRLKYETSVILSVDYQFYWSALLSGGAHVSDPKRIPYKPMHAAGTSVEIPWHITAKELNGRAIVSARLTGKRFTETGNVSYLDPHVIVSLDANQELSKIVSVYGGLEGGFTIETAKNGSGIKKIKASYESFYDYPMPAFTFTLGAKAKL